MRALLPQQWPLLTGKRRARRVLLLVASATLAALTNTSTPAVAVASGTAVPSPAAAGRLAYLRGGAVFVERLADGASRVRLPQSSGATFVSLASDGTVVFGGSKSRGLSLARPPYKLVAKVDLPDRAQTAQPVDGFLTRNGKMLFVAFENGQWASLDLETAAFTSLGEDRRSVSASGVAQAWASTTETPGDIFYVRAPSQPRQTAFLGAERGKVFDALRAQASPAANKLLAEYESSTALDVAGWLVGPPSLSPDGEALYWASNLGSTYGAAGNTQWVVFKTDVADGRTIALARYGAQFGRVPSIMVAPNGRKLLVTWSIHSSAAENPTANDVVDLASQSAKRLSGARVSRFFANIQDGECWGADSHHVAFAGFYYDPETLFQGDGLREPVPADFTIYVKDVSNDRTVRTIKGAVKPTCG